MDREQPPKTACKAHLEQSVCGKQLKKMKAAFTTSRFLKQIVGNTGGKE